MVRYLPCEMLVSGGIEHGDFVLAKAWVNVSLMSNDREFPI